MNTATHTPPALKACPFCACAMRIESNRDWHRIFGSHTEDCLFEEDVEQLMVPASPEQLQLMIECWNARPGLPLVSGMKKVRGDLIALFKAGQLDVIVHGQNCACNMDDGIAKTIAFEFPEAYHADLRTPAYDRSKLGTYSQARVAAGVVVNAYIQYHFSGQGPNGGPLTDYDALRSVFRGLRQEYGGRSLRFGVPAIGAARAGGDWSVISAIIDEELAGEDVTFVEYDGVDALRGDYRRNMGRPNNSAPVESVTVSAAWLDQLRNEHLALSGSYSKMLARFGELADLMPSGAAEPGDIDQAEDGMWTAGIHVGAHGNKIEVHDSTRETAEAWRDAICTALAGKVPSEVDSQRVTLTGAGQQP